MPATLNDTRFRQQQVNEAEAQHIERKLVDNAGGGWRKTPQQREILLRQFAARFNRQIGRLQNIRRLSSPNPERLFAAAADIGVAGKDLLDQGRAGARQADDQQRRLVVQTKTAVGGEKIPGEAPTSADRYRPKRRQRRSSRIAA